MSLAYSTFVPDDQNGYKVYDWGFGYTKKVDEEDSNTIYVGYAVPGSASNAAKWMLFKVSRSGNVSTISWAEGNCKKFDKIWDNRASYTYS